MSSRPLTSIRTNFSDFPQRRFSKKDAVAAVCDRRTIFLHARLALGGHPPSPSYGGEARPPLQLDERSTVIQAKTHRICETLVMAISLLAAVHQHADSVLALRIVFSICLAIVFFAGLYIFRIRKRLFDRDPEVTGDHYGARNLRLWQVILVWLLAMDLLIMALWKL